MVNKKRKEELKEEIYLTALRLFNEKGYEKVTVQEIANACHIAKGTFFNYFSKKNEILLYLGVSPLQYFDEYLSRYEHLPLKEQIINSLGDMLLRFINHGEIMKLAVLELIKPDFLIHSESQIMLKFHQKLVEVMQKAMNTKMFQSKWSADSIVHTILGAYYHTVISTVIHPINDPVQLLTQNLDIIWDGISSN